MGASISVTTATRDTTSSNGGIRRLLRAQKSATLNHVQYVRMYASTYVHRTIHNICKIIYVCRRVLHFRRISVCVYLRMCAGEGTSQDKGVSAQLPAQLPPLVFPSHFIQGASHAPGYCYHFTLDNFQGSRCACAPMPGVCAFMCRCTWTA